jgi:hypothetical protein
LTALSIVSLYVIEKPGRSLVLKLGERFKKPRLSAA